MQTTPVSDFIKKYRKNKMRFHMPGHKGVGKTERDDITEVFGADVLYSPNGVILESEKIASKIFGSKATFYSTEGTSLNVRAVVFLVKLYAKSIGREAKIVAVRNVHSSFISALALTDINPVWLYGKGDSIIDRTPSLDEIREVIEREKPIALYLTSPNYLGYRSVIDDISKICHANDTLLIVDNAHGAYLKFLPESEHPLDLGADICMDSAHKTLPCLTGTAYLHFGKTCPDFFVGNANDALKLFASTSPSYLLIKSLDEFNQKAESYKKSVKITARRVDLLKATLSEKGYRLVGNEPLKITIAPKSYGYTGKEIADILMRKKVFVEFYDDDYVTLMVAPNNGDYSLNFFKKILLSIPKRTEITTLPPKLPSIKTAMGVREAEFSPKEEVLVSRTKGRVLAELCVSCPPAVPILCIGEVIDSDAILAFTYYGIDRIKVVKN